LPEAAQPASAGGGTRSRGKGAVVSLSVRISNDDWRRATAFAMDKGISLNQLLLLGLSRMFTEKGLPAIDGLPKID
jgi:hypothetical protein